jgi:hypothetical protein
MPHEVARVVKHPHNIDYGFHAAVDDEMPRFLDNAQVAACPIAAEEQVVRPNATRQVRPILGSGPLGIGGNVAKRLLQKLLATRGRAGAKSLLAPQQRFTDVSSCGRTENDSREPAGLRHACPLA